MHSFTAEFMLIFEGRWHIGSGAGKGLIDSAMRFKRVWRDGKAVLVPTVPGSTLKGVLRQTCEQIAELFGDEYLDPHNEVRAIENGFSPLSESRYIVDRLFGSRFEGECLFVEDGEWAGEGNENLHQEFYEVTIYRNAINRATKTAKQDHLFSYNFVDRGIFKCFVRAVHSQNHLKVVEQCPIPVEYVLLLAGINYLNRIGSSKSTGLGEVRTEIMSAEYNSQEYGESWFNYLDTLAAFGGIDDEDN